MIQAKTVREWYAFFGGEELGISLEVSSIIWDAAVKSVKPPKTCEWVIDKDEMYHTSCNETWYFPEGGIKENGVLFCHHCGGKVKLRQHKDIKYNEAVTEISKQLIKESNPNLAFGWDAISKIIPKESK